MKYFFPLTQSRFLNYKKLCDRLLLLEDEHLQTWSSKVASQVSGKYLGANNYQPLFIPRVAEIREFRSTHICS